MKTLQTSFLLLALLALVAGGCTPQPPAKAQAEFDAQFTLRTSMEAGRMVFIGIGGAIDGVVNPELQVHPGDTVHLTLVNGDGMAHDLAIPDLGVKTALVIRQGDSTEVVFEAKEAGVYTYYCTVSGHRLAGMEGKLVVAGP
jgi:nitrite reductase (NO-forming)